MHKHCMVEYTCRDLLGIVKWPLWQRQPFLHQIHPKGAGQCSINNHNLMFDNAENKQKSVRGHQPTSHRTIAGRYRVVSVTSAKMRASHLDDEAVPPSVIRLHPDEQQTLWGEVIHAHLTNSLLISIPLVIVLRRLQVWRSTHMTITWSKQLN